MDEKSWKIWKSNQNSLMNEELVPEQRDEWRNGSEQRDE